MSAGLKHYLTTVENTLKAGNATEHTHRPALKALIESLDLHVTATNEPKWIACGAPDFVVTRAQFTVGYVEAKDVGKSLPETERTDQLKRYRRALDNLILTDYLDFRWYVDGELRQEARLATLTSGGKLKAEKGGLKAVEALLQNFLAHRPQEINSPKELAERLARLTHMIRDIIIAAFDTGQASLILQGWREAFAKVLIADLDLPEKTPDFADMFAQTLAYGLFTARVMDHPSLDTFSRQEAQYLIPKTNPFLRDFFIQITGPQLDDEPFASFVNDLVNLLAHTDMEAVLADFGRRTRQEDPVVHFYETFLAAYDPKLREARGVYYTPEPVVSYIVRSVDFLLKRRFDCPQGLADSSKITIPNYDPSLTVKGKNQPRKTIESHQVLVLDPATGTGTFLYAVVDQIRRQFMQQGNAGMWPGYVKNHLLPRLFGFELLMAPYAVAHFKLSLQLAGRDLPEPLAEQWAYHPAEGERLGVYLTNALEEAHEMTGLPLFTQWVADETNAANEIKRHLPVLVVMGNPPYSNFGQMNKGGWIHNLLDEYKKNLGEKKINLDDDFIKFIRFGQWRINQSGSGILAFVTNNTYIDGITHRQMRASLMETFSEIFILDLHGSTRKQDAPPNGGIDENVFDIQQGVSIGIFVKQKGTNGKTKVFHSELWGLREGKYKKLLENDISTIDWTELDPRSKHYFFVPKDFDSASEYRAFPNILNEIFLQQNSGIQTKRDKLVYHFAQNELRDVLDDFCSFSTQELANKYKIQDSRDWKIELAKNDVEQSGPRNITQILYHPFDSRWTVYTGKTKGFMAYPRSPLMLSALANNLLLLTTRNSRRGNTNEFFISNKIVDKDGVSPFDNATFFPLYLYPTEDTTQQKSLFDVSRWPGDAANGGRVPNLNPDFVAEMEEKLGLTFTPNGSGDLQTTFGPEDIFHYIYAVFHSPTYRARYAEFLKIDFPRVPLTAEAELFRALCSLGRQLVGLHLLESPEVGQFITRYPIAGDNRVEKGYPHYAPPQEGQPGRVAINKKQYFEGVPPAVWEFYVGGYQVLHKWLKDRRGRQLTYDELTHYQQVVVALQKSIELMAEIDEAVPEWPIQ